jgi:acyl-CoA reductase-like NAD-dependent aldehyde dehydrogenase
VRSKDSNPGATQTYARNGDNLAALTEELVVGDPYDRRTQIGPLVSKPQRERVEDYIKFGRAGGARVVTGGGRPAELQTGWFVTPTLFSDVDPSTRIAQEEIFGPVVCVIPYDDDAHGIAIANGTSYGLSGSVHSSDPMRGLAVARRIESGTVEVNGFPAGFEAPMGGVKQSGVGREFGPEGLEPYLQFRSIGMSGELAESVAASL